MMRQYLRRQHHPLALLGGGLLRRALPSCSSLGSPPDMILRNLAVHGHFLLFLYCGLPAGATSRSENSSSDSEPDL